MKRSRPLFIAIAASTVLVIFFTCTYFIYPITVPIAGRSFNKGENGLWLRYKWYAGDPEYWSKLDSLIEQLRVNQIRFAFFHVLALNENGTLSLRKEKNANDLIERIHERLPGVLVIAWVSLGDAFPAHGITLSDKDTRIAAVRECVWLTEKCNFDGVQLDYEPCT